MRRLPDSVYYDVEAIHEYGIDLKNREIFMVGEPDSMEGSDGGEPGVEFIMASRFIRNIRYLSLESHDPIVIHMKTNGGYWEEGMAIHNAIASCPANVTIINYTHARSMSSVIFQAADRRVMMTDSTFMFHMGSYAIDATVKAVESAITFAKHENQRMLDIYVDAIQSSDNQTKFAGWSASKIRGYLKKEMDKREDVYLTATDAVAWGFADEVFDGDWQKLKM